MYKEVEKVEGQICLPVEKKPITKVPAFFSIKAGTASKIPEHNHKVINV